MAKLSHKRGHVAARAPAYQPLGDQIDAIAAGFQHLRESGVTFPDKTLEWLDHILQVKETYKKNPDVK